MDHTLKRWMKKTYIIISVTIITTITKKKKKTKQKLSLSHLKRLKRRYLLWEQLLYEYTSIIEEKMIKNLVFILNDYSFLIQFKIVVCVCVWVYVYLYYFVILKCTVTQRGWKYTKQNLSALVLFYRKKKKEEKLKLTSGQ